MGDVGYGGEVYRSVKFEDSLKVHQGDEGGNRDNGLAK